MIEKEILFRKKRELGDILSDSFEFIKQEYKPILSLVLTYVLPFLILYGVAQVYYQKEVLEILDFSDPETLISKIGPFYSNILLFSLFGIFVQSLLIGTYYSYIEIYVKKGKGNFDLADIKPLLFSNSLLALIACLVVYVIVLFGIALCFIPGIYFANTFSIVVVIIIFEKKGLGSAMSRSKKLVYSRWWETLLLAIVSIAIIWAVSFVLMIPGLIAGISSTIVGIKETDTVEYPLWYWLLSGASTVISSLFLIVPLTFYAMQYFNLDERTKK